MLKWLVKLAFSAFLVGLVLHQVQWSQLKGAFAAIQPSYFAIACLILFAIHIIPSFAQKKLFQGVGIPLKLSSIYLVNLKSMFYGLAVPGDLAGGIVRYAKFSQMDRRPSSSLLRSDILTVMATERLLGVLSLLLLVNVFQLLPRPTAELSLLRKIVWMADAMAVGGLTLAFLFPWRRMAGVLPKKMEGFLRFLSGLWALVRQIGMPKMISALALLCSFQVVALFFFDRILALGMGLHLPWLYFGAVVFSSRLVKFLPLTYAGIGVSEGLYPLLLKPLEIPLEQTTLLALLSTAASLTMGLAGGVLEGWDAFRLRNERK